MSDDSAQKARRDNSAEARLRLTRPANRRPYAANPITGAPRGGCSSYGEVWLARNIIGTYRAVKSSIGPRLARTPAHARVHRHPALRAHFPLARRLVMLQVGRNDPAGISATSWNWPTTLASRSRRRESGPVTPTSGNAGIEQEDRKQENASSAEWMGRFWFRR